MFKLGFKIFLLGLFLVVAIAVVVVYKGQNENVLYERSENALKTTTVTIKSREFNAEVVATAESRVRGLGGRIGMGENEAMLFVFFDSDKHGIWMKDMNFPIDVVWIDESFLVTHIEEGLSPDSFPKIFYPASPASFVLELPAGAVSEAGLLTGEKIEIGQVFF